MTRWRLLASLLLLALASPVSAQGEVTPLFADEAVIALRLEGPIRSIARNAERSTQPQAAVLTAAGETHAITLAARGRSRRQRDNCAFPPLRIALSEKPEESSLFYRQRRIKLVTHCKDTDKHKAAVLREYAVYRLYGLVTPAHLKARLARVTYVEGGEEITTELGFLIEDGDDAARRAGQKEVDTGTIEPEALEPRAAARFVLFQYMIGNTDFAMIAGPDPADCCHNAKLFGAAQNASGRLVPVPYDFDNAGIVRAPYAVPNAALPIRDVRQRHYRGLCLLNPLVAEEAAKARDWRAPVEAAIASTPQLDEASKRSILSYLEPFWEIVADPAQVERKLLRRCRN